MLRLADADGASFLPALLTLEVPLGIHILVPLRSTLTNLLLPFSISPVLALTVLEFVQEIVDDLLEWVSAFAASNVASLVSTASLTKGLHHLANESHGVLISVNSLSFFPILGLSSLVISDGYHNFRSITRSSDLEHSVIITLTLFARSTQVEVLFDGGLVANATDGLFVRAAIASNALMDSLSFLSCHVNISEIFRLDKLFEDFSGLLLELLVDEVLNGFSGNSELLNLGLLGNLDLLFNGREGCVGLPYNKDELYVVAIGKCEGHLHVIVILNDNPIIAIEVLELDILRANFMLSYELVGRGDEGLVIISLYTLKDGAFALGSEVKG